MRLGYITKENPNDIGSYSGTHYSMLQALKNEFEEVIPLGPIDHWYKNVAKLKGKFKTFSTDKVFKYQYDIELAKKYAKILDKRILATNPDVILGSLVSPEVAFLKAKTPLYLTSDATFPLLQDYYKSHSNLYSESIKNALILERKAFEKARKLLFPLQWLKTSAKNHYRIPDSKIEVIHYGSNLKSPLKNEVDSFIQRRKDNSEIVLLFVGIRWEEKGGEVAVEVTKRLNDEGIKTKLLVVGAEPKIEKEYVEVIGYLDKQNPEELAQLIDLYKNSSFFILPTKAECVGMSFIEAASYGLPAIGTNVGGVPEAVLDKKTGLIFDVDETPETISKRIKDIWYNKQQYITMSLEAQLYYSEKMNWKNWAEEVRKSITST